MSFMNDFIRSIARTLGRIFVYLALGAIAYFIGEKFVFAQAQYRTLNGNGSTTWTNWNSNTGSISNTGITPNKSGKTIFQFRDDTTFLSDKYYDLYMEFEFSATNVSTHKNIDIINRIQIEVFNGTTLKNISNQCSTNYISEDINNSSTIGNVTNKITGSFTCTAVQGTGYYPYIGFSVKSNYDDNLQVASASLNITNWTYSLNTKATETNDLINANNANSQAIINNNNSNTQTIINNQNENTTQITEAIENQNKVCNTYNIVKNATTINNDLEGQLDGSGNVVTGNNYYVTSEFYPVNENKTYQLEYVSYTTYRRYCIYDESKNVISCSYPSTNPQSITPTQDGYIRFTYINNRNTVLTGEYCYNALEQQANATQDIADSLTDSSVDDPSNAFSSMESLVPTNGVVSGILLLPVQLYQAVLNSIDGTCSDFSLGSLYNHSLTMPCINLSSRLGATLYGVIDILISGLFVLAIRKKFVDIFEHFTSLKTGGNELE